MSDIPDDESPLADIPADPKGPKDAPTDSAEKPSDEQTDDEILKEARERYMQCQTMESDNRTDALDDLRFLSGGLNQWDAESARLRTAERRPCLTINNLPTFLHQVTNDQRKNKPAIHVHPVDDGADQETAKVLQGLIRHIEYDSNAGVAYNTAVNSAAAVGFGYLRLVTKFERENSFDQKIMFKRVRNALSVHIDPLSQEPDGSDQMFSFVDSLESRDEFKRKYPNANANNMSLVGQQIYAGWLTDDTVLVCDYYRIKVTTATLCMLTDGTTAWKDELKEPHAPIMRERQSARRVTEWFKMTGSDILERTPIKCKWIPVFPVYGDEIDIEGRVFRSGIIRNAKDPFRMYNYWMTLATEEVALRPKTPNIGAVGQFETDKVKWDNANNRSYSYIEYDPITVDGQMAPAPQRQPMADIPAGMLAMAMHAADNKKATTGLFDASLGNRGTATSGIQERAQQSQGDTANFHYSDGLTITVAHVGRCLIDMFPHYYDGARMTRIIGDDGTASQVQLNQQFQQTNPKTGAVETVIHDLTVGEYAVTVKSGPSYDTKREEAAAFLTSAMQSAKDPASANVITYLAFKNQDLAGADDATEMLKKLLPPGVAPPDPGQEPLVPTPHGPVPVSKVGPMIQQLGTALQNASEQLKKAQADKEAARLAEENNRAEELKIKNHDSDTKAYEAATARLEAEWKFNIDQQQAAADAVGAERDRLVAEKEASDANAQAAQAQAEAQQAAAEPAAAPASAADMSQIMEAHRAALPKSMKIRAPSGQEYHVDMGNPQ